MKRPLETTQPELTRLPKGVTHRVRIRNRMRLSSVRGYLVLVLVLGPIGLTPLMAQGPQAWLIAGQDAREYELSRDIEVFRSGEASMRLRARGNRHRDDWAVSVQMIDATSYRDKRIRLSGYVRSEDVGSGGLWLRVDGIVDENAAMLVMDNLEGDRVKGTKEWTRQNIVVDIPPESVTILIGAMITGDGDIWLDDLRFEEVSTTVELTASSEPIVTNDPYSRPPGVFPAPTNLSFEHPA